VQNWQGRAIYLDADQLVFGDIAELWNKPETVPAPPGCACWCSFQPDKFSKLPWPQTSVMVIDCAAAKGNGFRLAPRLDAAASGASRRNKAAYAKFHARVWMNPQPQQIGDEWNHLTSTGSTPQRQESLSTTSRGASRSRCLWQRRSR